ncbi:MAG: TPM domain-containing protein [Ignavibacteria bacterium]
MRTRYIILFLSLLFLSLSYYSYPQSEAKKSLSDNPTQLRQYVTDETGTLTPAQLKFLNTKLSNEDKSTSNQIIVYMISGLDGESLEDVSIRLAEKNKIGKKENNNGVLMLIVKDDRKIRIEVGYGLEGALTDALSSQIIRNDITPEFKSGNYYGGIDKGVDAIIQAIKGEYVADEKPGSGNNLCYGLPIFVMIIFGIIFFFIFISIIKGRRMIGRSIYAGKSGWSSGGWSSGGSSSSSFGGGGGFSGGGGSFGGGGASGSW